MRKHIQSIVIYEDLALSELTNQRIYINSMPAFLLKSDNDQLSFSVVLNLINVPEGTRVESKLEKIENEQIATLIGSSESIEDVNSIKGMNDHYYGTHIQMNFYVETEAMGVGYYALRVALVLNEEILEEDGIIIPAKKVGELDE